MATIREIDQDIECVRDMCADGEISGAEMFDRIEELKRQRNAIVMGAEIIEVRRGLSGE